MKTKILSILALLLTMTQGAWAFSGGTGTSVNPYQISNTTDWNNLVSNVNGGQTYSGKYFKMTANVGTVSTWMTGTFSGTFDGDGKTLTVGYSTSARYCAPFGTLGGTVKNLRVAGTLSTSAKNFGGIAAQVASGKTVTIQNCRVSAALTSTLSGDNSSGGFVGVVGSGGTLNMTGCAFTGSLQGSGATACGGFVGYKEGTCSMTDCLFAPASVTMSPTYAGTFSRPSAPTMTRCYYTRTLGTAQGLQARTIAAGDYVSSLSVTKGSATATYNVSGITVYSGGIDFNDGSTTTFYGGSGQTVSLDLTAETRTGYTFSQYAASQGTLASETTDTPTLTMPAANTTANDVVTISAEYTTVTLADGTEDAENWSATPSLAMEGQTVTITYAGTKSVKSVTAKRKTTTGNITVYFTDAQNYGDVNIYYWPDGGDWPGPAMTEVGTNEFSQKIYRAEIPATPEGIIFNGNGRQTQNITTNIADGSWWYTTDKFDDLHHYEVVYNNKYTENIEVTKVSDNQWTFTQPDGNVELDIEYYPAYPVTISDGDVDAAKWSATPTEQSVGQNVTLQYTGKKKIKRITIVAAPTARTAAEATAEDIGKLIGADGNIYDDAAAATAASTTAVAMIAYVGNDAETSTTYNHGLALALGDVSDTKNWCSQTEATCLGTGHQFDSEAGAKGDMAGIDNTDYLIDHAPAGHVHDAASAARGYNSGTHPTGTSAWFLPSAGQWDKMADAAGSYANLIANAGLQGGWDAAYWSSTEGGAEYAWFFDSSQGKLDGYSKDEEFRVRACLAF